MNYTKHAIAYTSLLCVMIIGAVSCKKYSDDEPLPDIYKSSVFVSSDNRIVYSLDKETGKKNWEFQADAPVKATPVLFKDALYIATTNGTLYKIDRQYGKEIDKRTFYSPIYATPIGYNNMLIVAVYSDTVYAVNPDSISGDLIWKKSTGGQIQASPTIHTIAGRGETGLFIGSMANKVLALNIDDGSTLWTYTPADAGAFYSSPCVSNDSFLYTGNDNGYLYAVKTYDGNQKWQFHTDGQVRSSPISIGGNVLFGSSDRYFYSVDTATGLLRWKVLTDDRIVSSPAVDNQYVYFGSYDFYIYCVDIIDGTTKWKTKTFGLVQSSPVVADGNVYCGSYDKNLYVLDTADGGQKWVFDVMGQMATSPVVDTLGGVAVPSISGAYPF